MAMSETLARRRIMDPRELRAVDRATHCVKGLSAGNPASAVSTIIPNQGVLPY